MAGTINENDMYTLLSQVFKPEVVNTLLLQLKGETKKAPIVDRVMPGDLITAELMNQVLAALADLQIRVSDFEATGRIPGLVINSFDPEVNVHVGDLLTIKGSGFSVPAERNTVTVGIAPVLKFNNLASDANNLVFVVVEPGLPLSNPIAISVTNDQGAKASKNLNLLAAVSVPQGRIEVPYTVAPSLPTSGAGTPGTFAAGEWIFGFDLSTIVNGNGAYRVTPSSPAAGWNAQLLDETLNIPRTSNQFDILGSKTQPLRIRLTAPTGGASSGTLRLDVVETTTNTKVTPGNQTVELAIGTAIPLPDNRIRLSFLPPQNAVLQNGRVLLVRSALDPGALAFNALVTLTGNYEPTVSYTNSKGWTTTEVTAGFNVPTAPPVGAPANGSFTVFLKAGVAADATDLIVTLTRTQGGSARFFIGIGVQ